MNDFLVLGALTGLTYGISQALTRGKVEQPTKRRSAPKRLTHVEIPMSTEPIPRVDRTWPKRVPVDTTYRPANEPQNRPAAPPQRKHRGTGPFGFTQAEMKAARKNFSWSVPGSDAPDYDGTAQTTGWFDETIDDEEIN